MVIVEKYKDRFTTWGEQVKKKHKRWNRVSAKIKDIFQLPRLYFEVSNQVKVKAGREKVGFDGRDKNVG